MSTGFTKQLSDWIDTDVSMDVAIQGVCQDSRLVAAGDAYMALQGASTHGYTFAIPAVEKGAVAVLVTAEIAAEHAAVTEQLNEKNVSVVVVDNLDAVAAELAAKFYGFPSRTLKVIAVTGTDGKTSVCQFIKDAMTLSGTDCGYIGTLGWGVRDQVATTALTTPDAVALQRMLATMQQWGAKAVAMEASSHGIAEGRLDKVEIDIAVLTNLGRDHLDYHVSESAYREAKAKLFRWPSLQAIVVNADDELGRSLIDESKATDQLSVHSFSTHAANSDASYTAEKIELTQAGIEFNLTDDKVSHAITTPLFGRFNVENLSACYAVLRASGVAANDCAESLKKLERVPGRMEPFTEFAQPTVIVDYAHTPQALAAAIDAVREHTSGKLWVVFRCGGDRDPGKRALMAKASESADEVIVTDDNPRTENPKHIRLMIINGFSTPSKVLEIGSRMRAIQHAIWHAQPDDVVLVAGKGHEDYQIVGKEVLEFSDRDTVARLLKEAS